MARLRYNFIGGKVDDNPLTLGSTTLTSGALAAFTTTNASPDIIVITLDPDGQYGSPEIVWITAHTGAATTATISRGREGTAARAHPQNTFWTHSPTAEDHMTNQPGLLLWLFQNYQ
jgi:hypothetical protein